MITLSFLARGSSFRTLQASFRVANQTISKIIFETCTAIYDELREEYLRTPSTPAEWAPIVDGFWNRWNCPNTLGTKLTS